MFEKNKSGLRDRPEDARDIFYEHLRGGGEWEDIKSQLPRQFGLKYPKEHYYNQYKNDLCVFFATAGMYNFLHKTKFSPIYLAFFGKKISNLNYGAYSVDGPKALKRYSTCGYDMLPQERAKRKGDIDKVRITRAMQQDAKKFSTLGYCRADSLFGNSFDAIRIFLFETKSPCIVTIPYYKSFNGTPDGGEYIIKKGSKYVGGHLVLCVGYDGDRYEFVDSFNRRVYMNKKILVGDSLGLIDFQREKIVVPKRPPTRYPKQEKFHAENLRNMLYSKFAPYDKARGSAGIAQNWFRMISALTYRDFTYIDMVNWIYALSRTGEELFDISKTRDQVIK